MASNVNPNFVWGEIEDNLLLSLQVLASLKPEEKIRVYDDAKYLLAKDDRYRAIRWMSDNGAISVAKIDAIMRMCIRISRNIADPILLSKVEQLKNLYVPALQGIDTLRKTYLAASNSQTAKTLHDNLSDHYLDSVSRITRTSLNCIADLYPPEAPTLNLPSGTEASDAVNQKDESIFEMRSTLQPNEKVKKLMEQGDNRAPQCLLTEKMIADARSNLKHVQTKEKIHTSPLEISLQSAKARISQSKAIHENNGNLAAAPNFSVSLALRMKGARDSDSDSEGEPNPKDRIEE